MLLMGEAHAAAGARPPLVGVAAVGSVTLPGGDMPSRDTAPLDPDHAHFVLVPGDTWGAESKWIAAVATALAAGAPSVTVLVNGGEIAYADVERSVAVARPVLVIAGSGRTADEVAAALRGERADERATAMAASHVVAAVSWAKPEALARTLTAILTEPAR